jgi:hypothetical protein
MNRAPSEQDAPLVRTLDPAYWIEKLGLVRHPEGGWYREIYRSSETVAKTALPARYDGNRVLATAIYYLLESGQCSAMHRLKSDELWFFLAGGPLLISCIGEEGNSESIRLGACPERGESVHAVVPAGTWFGARPLDPDSFSLVSCVVAPGFEFTDLEMGQRGQLLAQYPNCRDLIEQLCRP